jgi:hypothetical protein
LGIRRATGSRFLLHGMPVLILHLAAVEAHSFSPSETGEAYDISATPERYLPSGGSRPRPLHGADSDRERWMTYLSNVTNERPMLRISATIILAFICAAPFVLLFSGVVGYGVRSFIH